MPIVRIDIQAGKSTEYRRAILHGVRDAVTQALGVPADRVTQRIIETPAENIDATEVKSDRLTLIEVTMISRPAEKKEALYRAIAKNLGIAPGISAHDLQVIVNDPPAECFFLNGEMASAVPAAPSTASAPVSTVPPVADGLDVATAKPAQDADTEE